VTPELRAQIFELKGRDVPNSRIAAMLGLSIGSVRYQLDRRTRVAPELKAAPNGGADPGLGLGLDPAVADARRSLQLEQLNAQTATLRAQRLEAEKRLEILQKAQAGGDGGMSLLLLDGLQKLQRELEALKHQPAPAPASTGTGAILEQLGQLRDGWEAVRSIGGDQKVPSTEAELNMQMALDRLNMEREERQRKLDFELEERRRHLDNERIRAEAIAEQIKQWGPLIAQGAQSWLTQQSGAGREGAAASGEAALAPSTRATAAGLSVLPTGAVDPAALALVEGPCPNCGTMLRIHPTPGQTERCPKCSMRLATVGGKIWPSLPAEPVQRFAG
jgi:hypothetical protein